MTKKIGFPSSLIYFSHYPLWKTFFEELGFEFISSPYTNKEILDNGVRETVTDACVPIKIFHGHICSLKNKVDYLFIPRMVNVDKEKHITFCPKFLGLPDMIKTAIPDVPEIIEPVIDRKKGKFYLLKACRDIGSQLGIPFRIVLQAYLKSISVQNNFERIMFLNRVTPEESMEFLFNKEQKKDTDKYFDSDNSDKGVNIAVLGYPYQVYDPYISADIINRLREKGVNIQTIEMVPYEKLKKYSKKLEKNLFWHFSNKVVWSCYHYLEQPYMDGIVHVTAFGCGPDAMVDKLIELECKQNGVPFLNITIDEHAGEAGVLTRLEAFVDMIKFRRDKN